jgi:hypothetical protein
VTLKLYSPPPLETLFPLDDAGHYCVDHSSHYVDTWHEMEKLVDAGLAKTIGLSNFNMRQIRNDRNKEHSGMFKNIGHAYIARDGRCVWLSG